MTREECLRFIMDTPRPAVSAIVRADGRPNATPVWIHMDGDQIVFTTWHDTLKAKSLRRDPHISLCVDDDHPPFSFVIIQGTATISDDITVVKEWAGRIAGRYMGEAQGAAYAERNGVPGELLVRVTVQSITGQKDLAA
jgi:PPOX class probable F420-dependent enzyme